MAKKVHTVNLKGNYTYIDGIIEEETKTDIERYDLNSILKSFDGSIYNSCHSVTTYSLICGSSSSSVIEIFTFRPSNDFKIEFRS